MKKAIAGIVIVLVLSSVLSCSKKAPKKKVAQGPVPGFSVVGYKRLLPKNAVILQDLGNDWIVFEIPGTTNRYIYKERGTGGWLAPYRVKGR